MIVCLHLQHTINIANNYWTCQSRCIPYCKIACYRSLWFSRQVSIKPFHNITYSASLNLSVCELCLSLSLIQHACSSVRLESCFAVTLQFCSSKSPVSDNFHLPPTFGERLSIIRCRSSRIYTGARYLLTLFLVSSEESLTQINLSDKLPYHFRTCRSRHYQLLSPTTTCNDKPIQATRTWHSQVLSLSRYDPMRAERHAEKHGLMHLQCVVTGDGAVGKVILAFA